MRLFAKANLARIFYRQKGKGRKREGMMAESANHELVGKFVDFINAPDEVVARGLISPDIELRTPVREEPFRGPSGYMELLGFLRAGFPDVRWELEETVSEGDRIACRFTATGTHNGEFMGIPPTGRRVTWSAMNIYTFRDGLLVREYANPDLLAVLAQIGALRGPRGD